MLWKAPLVVLLLAAGAARALPDAPRLRLPDGTLMAGYFDSAAFVVDRGNLDDRQGSFGLLRYEDNAWTELGMKLENNGYTSSVVVNPTDGHVFVGGSFDNINGVSFNNIAEYDGKQLQPLGLGLSGYVNSLAHNGTVLFVGGGFTSAYGWQYTRYQSIRNIVMWANKQWVPLPGAGLDNAVLGLALHPTRNVLYAVGSFTATAVISKSDFVDQLVSARATATATGTLPGNFNASNILTNSDLVDAPGRIWAADGGQTLTINFGAIVEVEMIRVATSLYDGRGCGSFTARDDGDSSLTMRYLRRDRGYETSSTSGQLSLESPIQYTDFYFDSPPSTYAIQLTCISYIGDGPALSLFQTFSRKNYLGPALVTPGDSVQRTGTWTISSAPPNEYFSAAQSATPQTITYTFKVTSPGKYSLMVPTPACDCSACVTEVQAQVFIDGALKNSSTIDFPASSSIDVMQNYPGLLLAGVETKVVLTLAGSTGDCIAIGMASTEKMRASASGPVYLAIYDLDTQQTPQTPSIQFSSSPTVVAPEDPEGTRFVIGGDFTYTYNSTTFANLARLNTATNTIEGYPNGGVDGSVYAVAPLPDNTGFICGGHSSLSSTYDSTVALTNPFIYFTTNNTYKSIADGVDGQVYALAVLDDDKVFISGSFGEVYQKYDEFYTAALYMVQYSLRDDEFSDTQPFNYDDADGPYAFAKDPTSESPVIYVAVYTYSLTPEFMGKTAVQLRDGEWQTFGSGFDPALVDTLGFDEQYVQAAVYFNNTFYIAGMLTVQDEYDNYLTNIAMFNGSRWVSVGNGLNSNVAALHVVGDKLWVGGSFTASFNAKANLDNDYVALHKLAVWDGTRFENPAPRLATGSSATPYVGAITSWRDLVIVGGQFQYAGPEVTSNIAAWDGTQWAALGLGVDGTVEALAVVGDTLFVGGSFQSAGGIYAPNVAMFDLLSGRWKSITDENGDNGVNSDVINFAVFGNDVYMCGYFGGSYSDVPSYYLAKYDGTSIKHIGGLKSDSTVNQIYILPADNARSNDILPSGHVLLVLGYIYLQDYPYDSNIGEVFYSSAIFDGVNWHPHSVVRTYYQDANDGYMQVLVLPQQSGGLLPWQIAITVVLVVLGAAAIVGGLVYFFYYRNRAGK